MENRNILVIGNGFDLYHGLKTNYKDFVDYTKGIARKEKGKDDKKLALSNSFIQCFQKVINENKTWIDCEKEIEIIVNMFSKIINDKNVFDIGTNYIEKLNTSLYTYEFERLKLMPRFVKSSAKISQILELQEKYFKVYEGINKDEIIKKLKEELNDVIILFQKYLNENVLNASTNKLSKQIQELNPYYVINFNYTDTYKRYGIDRKDVCFIHGSANEGNMVLGMRDINEKDIDSIYFKKYFQRIQKKTNTIDWEKFNISSAIIHVSNGKPNIPKLPAYFFGHSLSDNDGDIIRQIYDHSSNIVIFHLAGNKDYEQKIINLISTLGKETTLQGLSTGRIKFEPIK